MNDKDNVSKIEIKTDNNNQFDNQFDNENYQPESIDHELRRDQDVPIGVESPLEHEAHCENTLADESMDITNRFNNLNHSREEKSNNENAEEEEEDKNNQNHKQDHVEIKIKSPVRPPVANPQAEYHDSKGPFHLFESENNNMPHNSLNTSCNIRAQTGKYFPFTHNQEMRTIVKSFEWKICFQDKRDIIH